MKKIIFFASLFATAALVVYKKKEEIQTLVSDMVFGYKIPCGYKSEYHGHAK